jgi:O-antigen/teichoic acid export membrane protein
VSIKVAYGMSHERRLRRAALRGGVYLAARQIVSILLKFVGVILITRVLGPANYGAYVSGVNIYSYSLAIGSAGVSVYLLRHEGDVPELSYGTAYSILMMMGLLLLTSIEMGAGLLANWTGVAGFEPVMRIIVLALPVQLLEMPASVRLERRLDYRSVAMVDIVGQIAFYVLAVPLVMLRFGPNALAAAWVLQQIVTCLAAHVAAKTYPRFSFDRGTGRGIVRYAAEFSVANWIWQLRMLVNPLIVGPALGAQAVGIVGMTIGLLEMLSIIKTIAWRLSVAILTKFRSDVERIRNAVTEGMELQVLAVGSILLAFGWTGHFIVPRLFGPRWIGVMDIYPYIALSYLTIATFNIHSATLSVINRNRGLAIYHMISVTIFAGVAYFAVSRFGILGYGYAELATIPAYIVMHIVLARAIGSPDYRLAALWWFGAAIGLFWQVGLWAIAVPFLVLLLPISAKKLQKYSRDALRRH